MNLQEYTALFDAALTLELSDSSHAATEKNIIAAMKLILGRSIKANIIKGYAFLVLDESLNVHFTVIDPNFHEYSIVLEYGK